MENSVVITSMSVANSLGNNSDDFSSALFNNKSGITNIYNHRVPKDFIVKYGSILKNVYSENIESSFDDSKNLLSILLDELFKKNSLEKIDGLIFGSNNSSSDWNSNIAHQNLKQNNFHTINDEMKYISEKSKLHKLDTISNQFSIYNTCVTGNSALGMAYQRIKYGIWENAIVGVTEQRMTPWNLMPLTLLGIINTTAQNEQDASCPFSTRRSGFIKGEGGAFLILESEKSALKRNAKILGRVLGYSLTSDAYQMTEGRNDLLSATHAIKTALAEAKIDLKNIGYINAHGTSTFFNDKLEVELIKKIFGKHLEQIPMSSTKSQIGHLNIACGLVEIVATLLMLENQKIAPTLNIQNDPIDSEIDFVPNHSREHKFDIAITNSFGFGGLNSTIVLGKA